MLSKRALLFAQVMELVENGTLKELLHGSAQQPAMPITWADPLLRVAVDCTEALLYLHGISYIHRDVKSENVLMTRTFTGKLADLGETRVNNNEDTMTQVGTAVYCKCSPIRSVLRRAVSPHTYDIL